MHDRAGEQPSQAVAEPSRDLAAEPYMARRGQDRARRIASKSASSASLADVPSPKTTRSGGDL